MAQNFAHLGTTVDNSVGHEKVATGDKQPVDGASTDALLQRPVPSFHRSVGEDSLSNPPPTPQEPDLSRGGCHTDV